MLFISPRLDSIDGVAERLQNSLQQLSHSMHCLLRVARFRWTHLWKVQAKIRNGFGGAAQVATDVTSELEDKHVTLQTEEEYLCLDKNISF